MPQEIQGRFQAANHKFGIVVTRFNDFITSRLLGGALDGLTRHGVADENVTVAWAPGSFEAPLVVRRLAQSGSFSAVICLACVIRGQTDHYDYVCQQITRGIGEIQMQTGVPVLFGVITCDTLEQAIDRAGAKGGNVGFSAACSAIEMADLMSKLP